MVVRSVSTDTTHFTLRSDGIVVGRATNPETPRTRENVSAALDELELLLEGEPRPGLWDPRLVKQFPPSAWSVLISRLEQSMMALAILVDVDTEKALGAFPEAIDAFLMPVRVFDDESDAIEWLLQFVGNSA